MTLVIEANTPEDMLQEIRKLLVSQAERYRAQGKGGRGASELEIMALMLGGDVIVKSEANDLAAQKHNLAKQMRMIETACTNMMSVIANLREVEPV